MLKQTTTLMVIATAAVFVLAGCPSETGVPGTRTVDLSGASEEQAVDIVADAVCDWTAECGVVWMECSSSSEGETLCSGGIEQVTYQQCQRELAPEIRSDFECVEMTDRNREIIETCMNAMVNRECMTRQEVDAWVAAEEAGEEYPIDDEIPVECARMVELFEGCEQVSESSAPAPRP